MCSVFFILIVNRVRQYRDQCKYRLTRKSCGLNINQ